MFLPLMLWHEDSHWAFSHVHISSHCARLYSHWLAVVSASNICTVYMDVILKGCIFQQQQSIWVQNVKSNGEVHMKPSIMNVSRVYIPWEKLICFLFSSKLSPSLHLHRDVSNMAAGSSRVQNHRCLVKIKVQLMRARGVEAARLHVYATFDIKSCPGKDKRTRQGKGMLGYFMLKW